jgi:hypothetical protein
MLYKILDVMLRQIFEQREQGVPLSIKSVTDFVKGLNAVFRVKTERAQDQSVRRFVAAYGLVLRVQTHHDVTNMSYPVCIVTIGYLLEGVEFVIR